MSRERRRGLRWHWFVTIVSVGHTHTAALPRGSIRDKRASAILLPCDVFQVPPAEVDGALEEERVPQRGG